MQDCQDEMKSVWCLAIFPSDYDCLNQTLWAVQSSKTTFSPGKAVCIKPGLVVCLNDCADLCSSHTHTKRKTCVMYATGHADSSDYCKSGSAQASGSMSPNESTRHRIYPLISTKVWWLLTIFEKPRLMMIIKESTHYLWHVLWQHEQPPHPLSHEKKSSDSPPSLFRWISVKQ